MDTLWQYLRHGIRMLGRRPGTTAVLVLTLALGIGANSAIFSVVDAVLLRPLPYPDAGRLVNLYEHNFARGFSRFSIAVQNFADWQSQSRVFDGMAIYTARAANLTGGAEPRRVIYATVSDNLFHVLNVTPALGRSFGPDDAREATNPIVILNHRFWQEYFGGDVAAVGRTIRLHGVSHTIVGVMPASFEFASADIEIWSPLPRDPLLVPGGRGRHFANVVGRLKAGTTLEQAQAELDTIASRLAMAYPDTNEGWGVTVEPLQQSLVANSRAVLLILWASVGFVLLIACSNVANILLAQSASREKEVAIQSALGAGRARIVGQMLAESVLLSLAGGAAGLLIAFWGVRWLPTLAGDALARMNEVALDWRLVTFTGLASVATGVLVGVIPALQASKTDLDASLKEAGRSSSAGLRGRFRSLLVVGEVALALVLLISAGLVMRSFMTLWAMEPGFDSRHVLTFRYTLPVTAYPEPEQMSGLHEQIVERIAALPEVESAGAISALPLAGDVENWSFTIDGRSASESTTPSTLVRHVSAGYLDTMRIRLLEGRALNAFDRAGGEPVVVISKAMAATYWPGERAIDRRVQFRGPEDLAAITWRVVGIADDVPSSSLDGAPKPTLYLSYTQWPFRMPSISLAVLTRTDPSSIVTRVRAEIARVDEDLPIFHIRTMEEVRGASLAQRRFGMLLLGLFAGVALVLAVVGLYGTIAYTVSQRTREIGIRMSLGARPGQILAMMVGQGAVLSAVGMVLGLCGAFALTRYLSSLLFGVSGVDVPTYAGLSGVLQAVALLASYLPSRRAARIEPVEALHRE